jgi:hypothetical protein
MALHRVTRIREPIRHVVHGVDPAVEQDVEREIEEPEFRDQARRQFRGKDERAEHDVEERHVIAELDQRTDVGSDTGGARPRGRVHRKGSPRDQWRHLGTGGGSGAVPSAAVKIKRSAAT